MTRVPSRRTPAVIARFVRSPDFPKNYDLPKLSGAPLGILVYKSRFLPFSCRLASSSRGVPGCSWPLQESWRQYQERESAVFQPAFFSEIAFTLWLVVKGAKPLALNLPRTAPESRLRRYENPFVSSVAR